jgi:hypothetical protein
MPSTSQKQHNFMEAVAHNASFAKKAGVPQSVGQEFSKADKGMKFKGEGRSRADLQRVNKPETRQGKNELFSKGGEMKESKAMVKKEVDFMKKKGAPKSMMKHEMSESMGMKKGGMTKMGAVKTAKPSSGSASSRADGVAQKGKTKGKMLNKGGMAC